MGLIRAAVGAAGGVMADQWKEFFYCEALPKETMMIKGKKNVSSRSSNTKGEDNIITTGSAIAVADGQCMLIVEQGKVVEVCAEPGQFIYDASTEPSIFAGSLGESIKQTFKNIGKRFTFGGGAPKDQRIYYINTKELMDNMFGTPTPVPFRFVDKNIGLDTDISVRCNGTYSYRISDPLLFYTNICGNVSDEFSRDQIEGQLKSEFLGALQTAFAKISQMGIRYSALPGHTTELADAMNAVLTKKWSELRGLSIVSVAINSISASKEDEDMIKDLQKQAVYRSPDMAGAALVGAQAEAMKAAASNESGAMTGFLGMGMAMNAAGNGMNAQQFYAMDQERKDKQAAAQQQEASTQQGNSNCWTCECGTKVTGNFCPNCGAKKPEPKPAAGTWKCSKCGAIATGNFCPECGTKKPAEEGWTCNCGTVNQGKFCSNCGAKRPAGAPIYRCDKCGWQPEDPHHPPKFCPECGDKFDDNDTE